MSRPFRQSHLAGVVAALLLATPAVAQAADPLLSGYAGPGGGEQSVLGSRLIPPATGNGSLRSTKVVRAASGTTRRTVAPGTAARGASAVAGSSAGVAAPTTATGSSGTPAGTSPGASASSSAASRRAATAGVTAPAAARQGATATAAVPAAATAPRIADAPATTTVIPLSHRQVLLGLGGLLLVGLCAWGTVVLAGPRRRPGRSA